MTAPDRRLSARLREATRSRHEAIEELAFFRALRGEVLDRQAAVSYLRGLSILHALLETALERAAGSAWGPWRADRARLGELLATLTAAGAAGLPDVPGAVDAAFRLADRILVDSRRPVVLLGHLYVLEGSQLGGRILRRHVAAALGIGEHQVAYGTSNGPGLKRSWTAFRQELDSIDVGEDEVQAMLEAARAAFDGIAELAEAAFPYEKAELRHRVTAINPEAGRHAMPQSDAEIARALRCADAAWRRYPYLEARYGERGRRFTLSDSCWLVSLYDLEEAMVVGSLVWLRGVLASRGLPTLILEGHLEMIDEDVQRDDPARAARATGFRTAIAGFRSGRDAHLSAAACRALAMRWQSRLDACPGTIVDGAASLLIAARLDTAGGIAGAWEQVRNWCCDPGRFSEEWIASVEGLAREVEAALGTGSG